MPNISSVNTSSAYRARLSFRKQASGDTIPDAKTEELARRAVVEIDFDAIVDVQRQANRVSQTKGVTIGTPEVAFDWNEPFTDANYAAVLTSLTEPTADFRFWEKSRTTTRIVFGLQGVAEAMNFRLEAFD